MPSCTTTTVAHLLIAQLAREGIGANGDELFRRGIDNDGANLTATRVNHTRRGCRSHLRLGVVRLALGVAVRALHVAPIHQVGGGFARANEANLQRWQRGAANGEQAALNRGRTAQNADYGRGPHLLRDGREAKWRRRVDALQVRQSSTRKSGTGK